MLKDVGVRIPADFETGGAAPQRPLLLCFSHLRWDFVFQRPQHLMTRFARTHEVHVWEEPLVDPALAAPRVEARTIAPHLTVVTPHLPEGMDEEAVEAALRALLDVHLGAACPQIAWYYTPMMLPFSRHIEAECTVYDCMDELANFRFAPPRLLEFEGELFDRADLVFTGGYSLYEAKRSHHPRAHPFPSSVDIAHFAQAREMPRHDSQPTFGFYGVLDERFDIDLLGAVADICPDWRFVMVGPVVKIAPEDLPQRANIFYPGPATYDELPGLLAQWDVALMPFAINDATKFISPTKTPEYLAAGKPVVTTPVRDVVRHYGRLEGVKVAATAEEFVAGCEAALKLAWDGGDWLAEVDEALSTMSWDTTQARMAGLIGEMVDAKRETAVGVGAVAG
jgi:UDP-galactopyranose mutase